MKAQVEFIKKAQDLAPKDPRRVAKTLAVQTSDLVRENRARSRLSPFFVCDRRNKG